MPNLPILQQSRLLRTLLLSLLGLVFAYYVLHALIPRTPVLLAQTHGALTGAQWVEGHWYWLEGAGAPGARLVRADASGALPIATADRIGAYAVAEGKAVWTVQDGNRWTITLSAADGSGKRTLWSGDREPRGLCLAAGRVFWLEQAPPAIPESGALPPLSGTVQVVSLPTEGGAPQVMATLLEPEGKQVLGVHGGQVYVSALRFSVFGTTTIYRIPLAGGLPHRVVGETNRQQALLTHDGALYWVAPSREADDGDRVVCIRRLGSGDRPETVVDWLPPGGQLYETDRGLCYVDGSTQPAAWPLPDRKDLPRPLPLPENDAPMAVGDGEILLQPTRIPAANAPVYRMTLP